MNPRKSPDAGDLVWITFDPQEGREQAGRRPALVLSPRVYNSRTGLALICPITSKAKGYPFEVPLPKECPIQGVVLADQVKSLAWVARKLEIVGRCPMAVILETQARITPLLGVE